VIIDASNGYYVLGTAGADSDQPPAVRGLGLHPEGDCIFATTISAVDDKRVLLVASYMDDEPATLLQHMAWEYDARAEIDTSDVLLVKNVKDKTFELTPGGGRFGVALFARTAPDGWSPRDPREEHALFLWPIPPTRFSSRFELPRLRPTESAPSPSTSVGHLTSMFQDGVTPLVRADFSDDAAWNRVVSAVTRPTEFGATEDEPGNYTPNIKPVDSRTFEGLDPQALAAAYDDDSLGFVLLADAESMQDSHDPTVIYVDLSDDPGRTFRCVASEVAPIEVNLDIANMDFEEFADSVGPDGVFRGFPED
jgi:hypothetical protein